MNPVIGDRGHGAIEATSAVSLWSPKEEPA